MISFEAFKRLLAAYDGALPLLTLDEFFDGNTMEDAIAPNQWGEGRPPMDEIWSIFRKAEAEPYVAWVRVVLHDDTEIEDDDGEVRLTLYGDSILLCTTARPEEIEVLVDCRRLHSDGAIPLTNEELNLFPCVPPVPEGFQCVEIVWD